MRIAYFGYDFFFSCLELLEARGNDIIAVFSNPCDNEQWDFNVRVRDFTTRRGIPFSDLPVTQTDLLWLKDRSCDLIVTAAYPYRIPIEEVRDLRGINVHPTLLPAGRGRWPLPHIILKKLSHSGVTLHLLREKFDAGEIVSQDTFEISAGENLETLSCKVQICARELLGRFLDNPEEAISDARPQEEAGVASHWEMPNLAERTLDWTKSVDEIDRVVRAFGKFGSYAIFDAIEWLVEDATVWKEPHSHEAGSIVHRTSKEVVVAAADGLVCLRFFQIDPDFERSEET